MTTEERIALLAERAVSEVQDGMQVGLGSGSTAEAVVRALGDRVASGLRMTGVATSANTARLASSLGLPLVELNDVEQLDLGIDGADEIDPQLNLVKGRGGALLWEKLVARTCERFIVVATKEKLVDRLGTRFPLPVEIVPFGWRHTVRRIEALAGTAALRVTEGDVPYATDEGNFIVDCETGPIMDPFSLDVALKEITGIVDHGLFIDIATEALTVDQDGQVTTHRPA